LSVSPSPRLTEGTKMRRFSLTLAAAMAIISLTASTGFARNRIEVTPAATLLSGRLSFEEEPDSGGIIFDFVCDVTLHTIFSRLIAKVSLQQVGGVTATLAACRNPFAAGYLVSYLPEMLVFYDSIRGTLPTITGSLLWLLTALLIETEVIGRSIRCLFRGLVGVENVENPVRIMRVSAGSLPLRTDLGGAIACAAALRARGTLSVAPEVTIRLLEAR